MTPGRQRDAYAPMNVALSLISETEPADRRDAFDLASRIAAAVDRPTEALAHLRRAERVRNELAAGTLRRRSTMPSRRPRSPSAKRRWRDAAPRDAAC